MGFLALAPGLLRWRRRSDMSRTDDRRDTPLPVTAEVGGEGGSYADPTMQVETFQDPLKDQRTPEQGGGDAGVANYALDQASVAGGGVGTAPEPATGMLRYPTEAPPPPTPPAAAQAAASGWRLAALGAAAGFVVGMVARRR
jgi:cell division septation protein DedD